jgi:hypothetical protein
MILIKREGKFYLNNFYRLTERSKQDYLDQKVHIETVHNKFTPEISKNSKYLTMNYHNVNFVS